MLPENSPSRSTVWELWAPVVMRPYQAPAVAGHVSKRNYHVAEVKFQRAFEADGMISCCADRFATSLRWAFEDAFAILGWLRLKPERQQGIGLSILHGQKSAASRTFSPACSGPWICESSDSFYVSSNTTQQPLLWAWQRS